MLLLDGLLFGSEYSTELSASYYNKSCYCVSNEQFDFTNIDKLTFVCNAYPNNSLSSGVAEFGLVSSKDSSTFVASSTFNITSSGPKTVNVDTSNIEGSYYIKILLKYTGNGQMSSYGVTISGSATITGE